MRLWGRSGQGIKASVVVGRGSRRAERRDGRGSGRAVQVTASIVQHMRRGWVELLDQVLVVVVFPLDVSHGLLLDDTL